MPLKKSLISFVKSNYIAVLYIVFSAVFFALLVYLHTVFVIKYVSVEGTNKQLYGLDLIKNKNILLTSEKTFENEIYARNPQISTITVRKEFPSGLHIKVELYAPVAYIKTREGYIELSENGKILSKNNKKEKNLPIIQYYQSLPYQTYQTGEFITYKDILYSLFFIKRLKDLGVYINNVDITGFYMLRLYNDKKQSFITTTDKEKDLQYEQLETIIKQFKLKGQSFTSIDVRFDKPVATF